MTFRLLRPVLLLALFALPLAAACGGPRHVLVLVTIGGLRTDAVDAERTPRLAEFLLDDAASSVHANSPETIPALAALMTGVPPDRLHIRHGDLARLPPEAATLAESMRALGYRTAAFVGDGRVDERSGLGRGFDLFLGPESTGDQAVTSSETGRVRPGSGAHLPGETVADAVGNHLRRIQLVRRAFLWVHLSDPEIALAASDVGAAYSERTADVESAVAYLADSLRTFGMSDRADIVVVSLHGMALGDQGERGHGLTLAPSVVEVRAGHSGPRPWPAGLDGPIDSAGTGRALAELAGAPVPDRSENAVGLFSWRPEREYGAAPRAAAGSAAGWLRFDPAPTWTPSVGAARDGEAGREAWPTALVDRLREGGFDPDAPAERRAGPSLESRLAAIASSMAVGAAGDEEGAVSELRALAREAPGALAPRLLLLRLAGAKAADGPGPSDPLPALRELASGSVARSIDVARALIDVGRVEEAARLVRELGTDGLEVGERLAAAEVLEAAGAAEDAMELVAAVADEEREAPELHEWLGDLALRAGNGFRARVAYETALESPRRETPNVMAKLGDAYRNLGEEDQALERYAAALELDPSYLYPHARAAEIFLARGETGAAAHAIAQSVPATRNPVADALERAKKMEAAGLLGEARAEYGEVLDERPANRRAKIGLARLHSLADAHDEAVRTLEELLDEDENAPSLFELARVHVRAGRTREAIAALGRLAAIAGPSIAEAARNEPLFRGAGPDSELARAARAVRGVERATSAGSPPAR